MSQSNRLHRAQREVKQEKQAKKVVNWIFGVLILLAVIFAIWTIALQ